MSFFDRPPPPPPPFIAKREPWRGESHDTLGVPVPMVVMLARTDDVAVFVSGVVAYPAGFALNLITATRVARHDVRFPGIHAAGLEGEDADRPELIRFGIGFSDGSKVSNLDTPRFRPPDATVGAYSLQPTGGGGGGRKFSQRFWCRPLPPPGRMAFVVAWPKFDIAETRHEVDPQPIIDAAALAEPIWPDDVGLPEEPQPGSQRIARQSFSAGRHIAVSDDADPER